VKVYVLTKGRYYSDDTQLGVFASMEGALACLEKNQPEQYHPDGFVYPDFDDPDYDIKMAEAMKTWPKNSWVLVDPPTQSLH